MVTSAVEGLSRPPLADVRADLEDLWAKFDELYSTLTPADWAKKFGKDWIFADQPYHMAYFDREMATKPIVQGESVPPAEQVVFKDINEINEWNAREFAKRPAGQTAQQAWDEWKAARDGLRRAADGLDERSQDGKVWIALLGGWMSARDAVAGSLIHAVGEYTELRMRLGRQEPAPTTSAVHLRLDLMMRVMGSMVSQEEARKGPFTLVWQYTEPGTWAWTFRVRDGACMVTEEREPNPDLTLSMAFETFERLLRGMSNPMLLMLTRRMKVKGFRKMGRFAKLFPRP